MSGQNLTLLDALKMAKEAEQKTAEFYSDAATKTSNPWGKEMFQALTEFERFHFQKLTELENSLREKGSFITYAGKELTISATSSLLDKQEINKKSVLDILSISMDIEIEAKNRYRALTDQTTDPDGKAMFKRLAEEEAKHHTIVSNAFWNLSDRGVWELPK